MKSLPINFRRVAIFAGIFVLILVMIEFNTRLEELNHLSDERKIVQAEATRVMQTEIALQTQAAFAGSDQAAAEWARTEGHYQMDGDQSVVPISQPGSEPVIDATPTPAPTPMPNWQTWWDLFFGK